MTKRNGRFKQDLRSTSILWTDSTFVQDCLSWNAHASRFTTVLVHSIAADGQNPATNDSWPVQNNVKQNAECLAHTKRLLWPTRLAKGFEIMLSFADSNGHNSNLKRFSIRGEIPCSGDWLGRPSEWSNDCFSFLRITRLFLSASVWGFEETEQRFLFVTMAPKPEEEVPVKKQKKPLTEEEKIAKAEHAALVVISRSFFHY